MSDGISQAWLVRGDRIRRSGPGTEERDRQDMYGHHRAPDDLATILEKTDGRTGIRLRRLYRHDAGQAVAVSHRERSRDSTGTIGASSRSGASVLPYGSTMETRMS